MDAELHAAMLSPRRGADHPPTVGASRPQRRSAGWRPARPRGRALGRVGTTPRPWSRSWGRPCNATSPDACPT